jgi:hypothetical protein
MVIELKENNKKNIIFSIVGVALFIACIIAVSYAYYTAKISVLNNDNNTVKATTTNISATFTDGDALNVTNILPGESYSKTFTLENTGDVAINYKIAIKEVENTFVNTDDLEVVIEEDGKEIKKTTFPIESGSISDALTIASKEKKSYTITITYKDTDINQIEDSGKSISGKIFIELV